MSEKEIEANMQDVVTTSENVDEQQSQAEETVETTEEVAEEVTETVEETADEESSEEVAEESTEDSSLEEKIIKKKEEEEYNFTYKKEAKEKSVDYTAVEIRNIPEEKRVIGTKRVFKLLRRGELAAIYVTKNAPNSIKAQLEHLASLADININELDKENDELGIICRKPFSISILGVFK